MLFHMDEIVDLVLISESVGLSELDMKPKLVVDIVDWAQLSSGPLCMFSNEQIH